MANGGSRISLLQAEPDLARVMSADDEQAAATVSLPVIDVPRGKVDMVGILDRAQAFGALVLDGVLFSHHRVGEQTALRVLGPGDVVSLAGGWRPAIVGEPTLTAASPAAIAVLGHEVLQAARRWPQIIPALHARVADQSERLAAQLTICQFPRVDQRLLAIFWLLAESWGRVTSAGTRLSLNLTHDALGALVGARRPTVTLALGELMQRGAIVRQDRGWLLLEAPLAPASGPPPSHQDVLIDEPSSAWEATTPPPSREPAREQLLSRLARLRSEHEVTRDNVRTRLAELAALREQTIEARRRIAEETFSRRQAPS